MNLENNKRNSGKITFRIPAKDKEYLKEFIELYNEKNDTNVNMTSFINYAIREQMRKEKRKL